MDSSVIPSYLNVGQGPPVLLLHSSLSSSGQWRELICRLRKHHQCLAIDLYGYGGTGMPERSGPFTLWQEVELLENMLEHESIEQPLRLVGHSYGAAVALAFAQKHPERISRLVLFEPVCFSILDADDPGLHDLASVLHVFDEASTSYPAEQARRFIEYWNGAGAFDAMPERLQQLVTRQVKKVDLDFQALMHPTFDAQSLRPLGNRLSLLYGEETRASSGGLVRQLSSWLPDARIISTPGGHMAPLTHERAVNDLIEQELQR